jgi:anti-sigma regulatory factor (Ser/Thr protein kinase)/cell fate (sporulation/competence/biofilm development) regulator YlbF (YheA/YmcA/DUF963 family)
MGTPKVNREFKGYWILILGAIIISASFVTISVIWSNVDQVEKLRLKEHGNFTENISKTADYFLSNKDYEDFTKTRELLKEINFLDEVAVFIEGKQVLPVGININWPIEMSDPEKSFVIKPGLQKLYVQHKLEYHKEKQASIRTIFSLEEYKAPKAGIIQAFIWIGFLLLVLSGLGFWLYLIYQKLRRTEKTKADTIYGITHDAKQDLFIINAKLSSLIDKLDANKKIADLKKDLKISQESIESIYRFVDNLNDQQKMQEGKTEIRIETIDVTALVGSVMHAMEEQIAKRNMRYAFDPNTEPMNINADPQVLKRIVKNLMHNAMKYSAHNTEMSIRLEKQDSMVHISIKDQGPGIDKKHWEKIFQPYFQINSKKEGMGLGLATSRTLAERMNGNLQITNSAPGKGTEFTLAMPLAKQ